MPAGNRAVVSLLIQAKDMTGRAFAAAKSKLQSFKSAVLSITGLLYGITAFIGYAMVKSVVNAFSIQEEAVIKLNAALAATGRYSAEASEAIIKSAGDIQKLTRFGDEAIIKATTTVAQLANQLQPDDLIKMQKALVGIADTFFGGDIESAALIVGKAIGSPTNALSRYGITLDTTGTQQEKLNQLLAVSAPFFQVAADGTDSLAGRTQQMSNAFGDLKEVIGEQIVEIFHFKEAAVKLRDTFVKWQEFLNNHRDTVVRWGRSTIAAIKVVGLSFWTLVRLAWNAGQAFGNAFEAGISLVAGVLVTAVDGWIEIINLLIRQINRIPGIDVKWQINKIGAQEFFDNGIRAVNDFNQQVADVEDTLNDLGQAWFELAAAFTNTPLRIRIEPTNTPAAVKTAKEKAEELLKEVEPLLKKFSLGLIDADAFEREVDRIGTALREVIAQGIDDDTTFAAAEAIDKLLAALREIQTAGDPFQPATEGAKSLKEAILEAFLSTDTLNEGFAHIIKDTIQRFGAAIEDAFTQFVSGAESAGEAFKKAMLGAIAAAARGLGELFLGHAAGEVAKAIANPLTAGQHLAAAAKFTAAAVALFALAGTLGAVAGGGGAGGGAPGSNANENELPRGRVTIYFENGPIVNLSDPEQRRQFKEILDELGENRDVDVYVP